MTIGVGVPLAFMMSVATSLNAIVLGTRLIKQREMMKAGAVLNLFSAILLAIYVYIVLG